MGRKNRKLIPAERRLAEFSDDELADAIRQLKDDGFEDDAADLSVRLGLRVMPEPSQEKAMVPSERVETGYYATVTNAGYHNATAPLPTKLRRYVDVTVFDNGDVVTDYKVVRTRSISRKEFWRTFDKIRDDAFYGSIIAAWAFFAASLLLFFFGFDYVPEWLGPFAISTIFWSFPAVTIAEKIHKRRFRGVTTEEQQIQQGERDLSELARRMQCWMQKSSPLGGNERKLLPIEAVFAGLASENQFDVDLAVKILQQMPAHVLEAGLGQFGRYASNSALIRLLNLADEPKDKMILAIAGPQESRRKNMPEELPALTLPNDADRSEPTALPTPNCNLATTT